MNKYYVTTPIYYANDKPHIGHAYTTIAADVLARYHKLRGEDVWFLTGLDEHGSKVPASADKLGKDVNDFVDEQAVFFKKAWQNLNISNDDFIRTTERRHKTGAQKFLQILKDKNVLYKGKYSGLYCVGCEKFITGKELVNGKCPDHKKFPEKVEEENWFFKLSDYSKKVRDLIIEDEIEILPKARKNEVLGLFDELDDFSVSREKVKWGVPLPFDKNQITYVWIEALTNYLNALDFEHDGKLFKKFWPVNLHLMAKEIIKFHCIFWPAMLLAAGFEMPRSIFAHGFFTINGEKMSKTIGNVIDPNEMVGKFGADGTRYLLLTQFPFGVDGDVQEDRFAEKYNADLANKLGNLVSRTIAMTGKFFGYKVPKIRKSIDRLPLQSSGYVENCWNMIFPKVRERLNEDLDLYEALNHIWRFIDAANTYVDKNEPWNLAKQGKDIELSEVMYDLLFSLKKLLIILHPFIPEASLKIAKALGLETIKFADIDKPLKSGKKISKIEILFPRVEK
ncbi:MAG: hypothetical protein ACD_63C00097G0002 [uncultured bacterium]|nr:MAG: hypothetical protein ACD_63C00097G0002 [uncultured bacterium]